jgi:hypothetical protein
MTVTSAQHVDCYQARVGKEMHRGEDYPEQPIRVLAIVRRVTPTLSLPQYEVEGASF